MPMLMACQYFLIACVLAISLYRFPTVDPFLNPHKGCPWWGRGHRSRRAPSSAIKNQSRRDNTDVWAFVGGLAGWRALNNGRLRLKSQRDSITPPESQR